jgi:branched-chain amino acid transport system substrate-binding protein
LGAVAVATDACAKPVGSAATQSLPTGEDLVFGASLELTGSGSVAGTAQERGLKIARDILNTTGVTVGNTVRKIQLTIRDNGSDPTAAAAIAQQFINSKVSGIIGGCLASTTIAMSRVAEPHGIPLLSTSAADLVIGRDANHQQDAGHRFIFKLGPNATDVATLMRAALDRESATKVGLLAANNEHGDAGVDAVKAMLADSKRQLTGVERLPDGAQNYQPQADRIAAGNPDAVIIFAVSPVAGLAARAMRGAKFNRKLLFDSGAASEESLTKDNRAAMADSYVVAPQILGGNPVAVNTPNGVAQRDFYDRYSRAYGTFSALGVFGADALDLLASAATQSGGSTPLRIRNELEAVTFDGLAGSYKFSTADHGGMQAQGLALFLLQSNGGWLQLA